MTIKEMVSFETENGNKPCVIIRFNGWIRNANEVITELNTLGYAVKRNCMAFRHHAVITAERSM